MFRALAKISQLNLRTRFTSRFN